MKLTAFTDEQQASLDAAWAVVEDRPADIFALLAAYPHSLTLTAPTVLKAAIVVITDSLLEQRHFASPAT